MVIIVILENTHNSFEHFALEREQQFCRITYENHLKSNRRSAEILASVLVGRYADARSRSWCTVCTTVCRTIFTAIRTAIRTAIHTVPLRAPCARQNLRPAIALGTKRSQQCGQNKNKHIMEIERVEQEEQVSEKLVLSE